MNNQRQGRRDFLKTSATALATPYFFSSALASGAVANSQNDRFGMGLIGAGRMGYYNSQSSAGMCEVVAVCDVDKNHLAKAVANLSGGKAKGFNDYRHVLELPEVDVVYIATPDHWHAKILIEAMLAGKDAYCEKPLTLTVDEGKLIRRVQQETGCVVQVGTMQRSFRDLFVKAVAIAQQGRLGKITRLTATIGGSNGSGPLPVAEVPDWLDWNQWLGPAPQADFRLKPGDEPDEWNIGHTNAHQNFRWWFDYSGGKLTDWGAHHVDIACWALRAAGQSDELLSIGGESRLPIPYKDGYPTQNDRYNTPVAFDFTAQLKDGVELVIRSHGDNGVLIEGTKGRVFVNRGKLVGAPVEALKDDPLPEDAIQKAYRGMPMQFNRHKNHWANFVHCVRERSEPISDVTSHLRALDICHLANISARFDRPLTWDARNEQIVGDDQANTFLARPYRKGFEIEM